MTVIADLFAVKPEDRLRVQHWSDDLAYFLTSIPIPAEACDRIGPTLRDLETTMAAVVEARRGHSRGEFIDELIRAEEDRTVLETADLMANATAKLERKRLDLIVANDVSAPNVGFQHDTNEVCLLAANGMLQRVALTDKRSVARAVLDAVIAVRSASGDPTS